MLCYYLDILILPTLYDKQVKGRDASDAVNTVVCFMRWPAGYTIINHKQSEMMAELQF